ncbi:MAG: mechanosensitive ion channel [Bacteroidales bacterium]|nr:mechanosensitive ion channel [Bacteroidales bacterium]
MYPLQTSIPLPPQLSPDSLAVKEAQIQEVLKNTPPDQLLSLLGEQLLHFGLKVLAAIVIYAIGAWVIGLIRKSLKKSHIRHKTEPTLASFTESLVTISLWVVLIVLVIGALGVNTTSLAALLAAGGMAIGMALSGTVQNFAGGIMLLVFKPFKVGDFIEALGYSGTVTELTIVNTKLITPDNRVIILPNGALSGGNINNINKKLIRRIEIPVSVAYGTDAQLVRDTIIEIVKQQPLFLDATTPGAADPFVALKEMAESSVNFVVRVWVKVPDYWDAYFWLNERIYTQLPQKGISFPFPQMDIHVKSN